jgi:hypothetical protein
MSFELLCIYVYLQKVKLNSLFDIYCFCISIRFCYFLNNLKIILLNIDFFSNRILKKLHKIFLLLLIQYRYELFAVLIKFCFYKVKKCDQCR